MQNKRQLTTEKTEVVLNKGCIEIEKNWRKLFLNIFEMFGNEYSDVINNLLKFCIL